MVEMVVVMCIVLILGAISATALLSGRKQAYAADAAESLLATIREAQNRSISVKNGKGLAAPNETKIWGVHITKTRFELIQMYSSGASGLTLPAAAEETPKIASGVSLTTRINTNLADDTGDRYIFFNTPFGNVFTTTNPCSGSGGTCTWSQSTKPTHEWSLSPASASDFGPGINKLLTITVSFNGARQVITVQNNGDAKIE